MILISAFTVMGGDVNLTFDHFYDGPAAIDALNKINKGYPNMTSLQSLGKSH